MSAPVPTSFLMPLSAADRAYVVNTAVDLLRHRKRDRLLRILGERISHGRYEDAHERDLDEVAWSIAKVVDEELSGGAE